MGTNLNIVKRLYARFVGINSLGRMKMKGIIKVIGYKEAIDFLLPRHYSGRKPQITTAFGWYINGELNAVCTFGSPASPTLCKGVCGEENAKYVIELNRVCRLESCKEPLSSFISACLRRMSPAIVVSFSDTEMNHHGYIYQACNFIYTGCTKERTDKYTPNGKHSRHYKNEEQNGLRKVRSAKHRYIYFCDLGYKKLSKQWKKSLRYKTQPYPKGDNSNYTLGNFLKQRIINTATQEVFRERENGNN